LDVQDFPLPAFPLLLQPSAVERLFSAAEQIISAWCLMCVKNFDQSVFCAIDFAQSNER